MSRRPLSRTAIWAWPVSIGILTAIGLVAALFSDGSWGDALAGACLAVPVVVGLWFGWIKR